MIKLRGFGGKTEFWEHNLESFTLMAGLAAVTSKIQLFATAATLTLPPAIVARMASTIDSISGGRFGVNLVTGWQSRVQPDGPVAGDEFFGTVISISASTPRCCATSGPPAAAISRASTFRWRTAASARNPRRT